MNQRDDRNRYLEPIGHLPGPELLTRYEQALPGSATKILDEFTAEAKHRREQESQSQAAQIKVAQRGQMFGLIIGLAAIISGAVTACVGSEWAGGFIGGGGVIGLVSVFVLGRVTGQGDDPPRQP